MTIGQVQSIQFAYEILHECPTAYDCHERTSGLSIYFPFGGDSDDNFSSSLLMKGAGYKEVDLK